ncbi:RNA polymerase sigma factor [Candidatus Poribacteria bacterium]|nr:RNA polymerase sigma factor [Candidatus Poribacteria bacterium]
MRNNNAELIQRILEGDDTAFACLVKKYQKRVHALAWRKIGDFHIAEDITQETFLQVYRKLATLKDPNQFPGWLYVIANRRCLAWLRKKRIQTEQLEEMDITMTESTSYSKHIAAEQSENATETKRELVKNLLAKLKESDRTVLTLYYFGEMTYAEISEFLGVSVNTVATRVHRARKRLKQYEPMIRETLSSFQLSPNLMESIVREIPHIKPLPPTGSNSPVVPWAIATSMAILTVIGLGISNQYSARFQQPYSFDATSETTVEIIDAPIVLDFPSKPDVRNQVGAAATAGEGGTDGSQTSKTLLGTAIEQNSAFFQRQTDPITIGKSMTWVHGGDKWDPSMAIVRTEFNGGITYSSKEYAGPQTIPELMNVFDEIYDLKHSDTTVTVFSRESIAEINPHEVWGLHAWQELLSKKGISSQFTLTEIDARYPRNTWLQRLLERSIIIENLADYFFIMAHRYQLAFLEDNPYLWETEIQDVSLTKAWEAYKTESVSLTKAWEAYKTVYIDELIRYYTERRKSRD